MFIFDTKPVIGTPGISSKSEELVKRKQIKRG